MLQDLFIKDFALIDSLGVSFDKGLNIITGETGAGKSIIVGALNLLIGGRASPELIRSGANEARVEAVFNISSLDEVRDLLSAWDIPCETNELIITRVVSKSGRNKITIGGRPATLHMLTQLGGHLLDISGQYSQQLLLQDTYHIDILDGFAGIEEIRRTYEDLYASFQRLADQLTNLTKRSHEVAQHRELLEFQYQEITRARLRPGEEEELLEEKKIISNAQMLRETTYGVYSQLYEDEHAVIPVLQQLAKSLKEASIVDHTLLPLQHEIQTASLSLEDCARSLYNYSQKISVDPHRLDDIETRLAELHRLKKKYGNSVQDILSYQSKIEKELAKLQETSISADSLHKSLVEHANRLWELAETLSQKRREAAAAFKKKVEAELSEIGFRKAIFTVVIDSAERLPYTDPGTAIQGLTNRGKDTVQFYISPNYGEEEKPLSRIASGGELSRIVLAIKRIAAQKYRVATLVFDEVDAGIGGAVAESVGAKLQDIARRHQVICITHVPQIAVFGTSHFAVTKTVLQGRTVTAIAPLSEKDRQSEIARMLGGRHISSKTLAHAREMLDNAQRTAS